MSRTDYEREEDERIKKIDKKIVEILLNIFLSMITAIIVTCGLIGK